MTTIQLPSQSQNNNVPKLGIAFLLVLMLVIVGFTQAQNMLRFPYFQDVEGTNVSNSWALLNTGELSPYTYAYENPPAGSFILTFWNAFLRGVSDLTTSIESGRMLMLGFHVLAAALIFGITFKIARSALAAIVATLIFSFSPLMTALGRQVLVENIMLVWLLAAFYLVLGDHRRLSHYLGSAFFFGLAALTDTSAMFFLPAMLIVIVMSAHQHHRRFASTLWITLSLILVAFFPIYAQMKQELFPQGWFLGGDFPHVSLVERIADRGPENGRFLNAGAGLESSIQEWINLDNMTSDPVVIYAGLIALALVLAIGWEVKRVRVLIPMAFFAAVYLLFGGQIFTSDALLFVPLLIICLGVVIGLVGSAIGSVFQNGFLRFVLALIVAVVCLYPFSAFYGQRLQAYTVDQVEGQMEAIEWVARNLPEDAVIVTDNYAFVQLRETHENTHHYWKVDTDPAVRFNVLNDNVCNIDYIIATPQVLADINGFGLDLMRRTYEQSQMLRTYDNNGWPVEIRQVSHQDCQLQQQEEATA
jgi:4-amino-4-deoxy-L-arabinose transferase-like glycosyltransferase